jgi:hypothetical protein
MDDKAKRILRASLAIARLGNRLGWWRIREIDELTDEEILAGVTAIREAFGED